MGDLTEHFSRHEFRCKGQNCCAHSAPISLELVRYLEDFWQATYTESPNFKIIVLSGFRCLTHNREVHSEDTSQHCLGLAADIHIPEEIGWSSAAMAEVAKLIPAFRDGGIGIYEWGLHLDIGRRRALWRG